jgi:ankyrin repeat protein
MPLFVSRFLGLRSIDQQLLTLIEAHVGLFAIERALESGADASVQDYRSHGSRGYEGNTPLHYASRWRGDRPRQELVKALLSRGADPNATSRHGHSPLHYFATAGDIECVSLLLGSGGQVEVFNLSGETPLHNAAAFAHEAVVRIFLDTGADVNARQPSDGDLKRGYSPLHSAVFAMGPAPKRLDTIKLLLERGADLALSTGGGLGQTPLQRTRDQLALVQHGYNPSEEDRRESVALMMSIIKLLENGQLNTVGGL